MHLLNQRFKDCKNLKKHHVFLANWMHPNVILYKSPFSSAFLDIWKHLKRNQFAATNSPWPFRCSYAGLSIGVANFGAKLFGASPIGMHCWAGLQEKTWAYWLSNWKKRWENDHFSLDKEIYEFDGPYSPLHLHSWKFPSLVKLSPHVSHYIDSIITISIQQSESTIYIYLQSMVVRTLWCFMIHWFEKKHSNDLSPEQRERCRVLLVGFSSCVAWWTTMGYQSSKRRP